MKIAHLIFSFSPGGAEILVKDLVLNSSSEHLIEVWSIGKSGDTAFEEKFIEDLKKRGISVVLFNKTPHKNRFRIVRELRNTIRERNPDILHTHSEIVTIYAILASIGYNKTVIETIHNTVISYPFLQRMFLKQYVKKYVAISINTYELIKKIIGIPENRIEIIFNGIDVRKFQSNTRKINTTVKNVLAVGRLDEQKDHMTLLESYSLLRDELKIQGKDVPLLTIVGIGKLKDKLEQYTQELKLKGVVIFAGARNDIPDLLAKSDLWVMSSKWEGLSIALLEALASGIPVIATNVGSNGEVLRNGYNGSLVPSKNPQALADEILRVITNNDLRTKYSINAIKTVEEFGIQKCAAKYNSLYSSYYSVSKSVSLQQY